MHFIRYTLQVIIFIDGMVSEYYAFLNYLVIFVSFYNLGPIYKRICIILIL